MTLTRFVFREALWSELQARVRAPARVRAAVAYIGTGGAKLLPLKADDELIVDMSLPTVRHGATDPKEIRKLIRRGVRVWTRESLHAKFFVMGNAVLAGSANISRNAYERLDEAGLLTTSPAAVRQALAAFAKMCTEPVRPKYLAQCIKEYRPPVFNAGRSPAKRGGTPDLRAKLWFVGRVVPLELSDAEERILEKADEQARKRLRLKSETELNWVRFGKPPAFWKSIQPGDWLLCRTIENGQPAYVEPPQQVLGFDTVKSARGKVYHRVLLESLSSSEEMPWSRFQRRVASAVPRLAVSRPRGGPIVDDDAADVILGFWTANGKLVRSGRRGR